MTRRLFWLSLSALFGLLIAVVAVVLPAQAAKSQPLSVTNGDSNPPVKQAFGVVSSLPDDLIGPWTVDKVVYTATNETHFNQEEGPFYVGACVQVAYDPTSFNALWIATVSHSKCGQLSSQYLIGLIDQVPSTYTDTLTGTNPITATWVISGVEFVSTPQTRFETENGPLAEGTCASVKYQDVNGTNIANEIQSEKMYRCLGNVSFNQAFGYLVTYPSDLVGTWMISDTNGMSLTFESTASTVVYNHGSKLQEGACTGVKYYTDQGINYAAYVRVGPSEMCHGRFGQYQPPSKLIATVDSMPDGTNLGDWVMAGVTLSATEKTRFEEEHDSLAVGSCADAKYDPTNGAMQLYVLEGEETEDCQTEGGMPSFKLFGMIEAMPSSGITGTWQVSGVSFQAISTTQVDSRHGDFAIGAYVKVNFTYDSSTGERTAQMIQTHVAPGYGWKNFHGRFEGWIYSPKGDKLIVDGQTYNVDPDVSASANLQNGDQVWVNAYQENGATFVTQVSLAQDAFLPMVNK